MHRRPELLSEPYTSPHHLSTLARQFAAADAVVIPQLLRPAVAARLRSAIDGIEPQMRSKDFTMPGFETPRIMSVFGARDLVRHIPSLQTLYTRLLEPVGRVVGKEVFPCVHQHEAMVLNRLDGAGQTHGWHVDDPAYALVIVLTGVGPNDGGQVEYIQNWQEECCRRGLTLTAGVGDAVAALQADRLVRTVALQSGDAYVLRADTSLHRVTEIVNPTAKRVVLNFAYQADVNTAYAGTADLLYA